MEKKKGLQSNKEERKTCEKDEKRIKEIKKKIILPVIFYGSYTSSNITEGNSKPLHEYVMAT
jgi:hypothetical protein